MYEQNLIKSISPIRLNTIKRFNKSKKWEYGYNKDYDIIIISKTGRITMLLFMLIKPDNQNR